MIKKDNYPIARVSWLSTLNGKGCSKEFYEPETIEELTELCADFYSKGLDFDLIGHTSNTLYTPDYVCERMVSTRKVNHFEIKEDCIWCECGTSVRSLSIAAVNEGIKGFEGLIDLPGTVASAIYGHATCYNCDLSSLMIEASVLTEDGKIQTVKPEWFGFARRSSVLKRKEKKAVILSLTLVRENGDVGELKNIAEHNHTKRKSSQPEAKNSLGSLFFDSATPSRLNRFLYIVTKPYAVVLRIIGNKPLEVEEKRKKMIFTLLGAKDVAPYVKSWNWYQWSDEQSHSLFWKFVRLRKRMFVKNVFEIEIKHNSDFIIP